MRGKQVGIVLIAIIALGVAGLVARLASAVVETEEHVLTGVSLLNADALDKVVMREEEYETILTKQENGEWWAGPYPVDETRFEGMWEVATRFDGADLIATNPDNHERMGVTSKYGTSVQFWRGEELQDEFMVGSKQIFPWKLEARLCFLRRPEQDDVYGVFCPFPEPFGGETDFWRHAVVAAVPRNDVEIITYTYPDEEFSVRIDQSLWYLEDDLGREQASFFFVQNLLDALEQVVTSAFPAEKEVEKLDFSNPAVALGVGTKADAITRSVLLLFLEKSDEEGSYYVKDAEKPYVYVVDERTARNILKARGDLLTPLTPSAPATTP